MKLVSKIVLTFVFSIFLSVLFAQETPLKIGDDVFLFTFKKGYYVLTKDSLYSTFNGKEWTAKEHDLKLNNFELSFLSNGDIGYLFTTAGGKVYQFSGIDFKSLNNSSDFKNQCLSYPFLYNNKIHLFGGYGLFTFKNIFTYFDDLKGEWEMLPTRTPIKDLPDERRKMIGQINGDNLYIGSGHGFDRAKEFYTNELIQFEDYWKFNLKTLSWEKLGANKAGFNLTNFGLLYNFEGKTLLTGFSSIVYAVDIERNELTAYKKCDQAIINTIPFNYSLPPRLVYNSYTGKFLCLINQGDKGHAAIVISKDQLLGKPTSVEKLYNPVQGYTLYYIGILLVVLILITILIYSKHKRNQDIYNRINKSIPELGKVLSTEEQKLFKLIFDNHPKLISFPYLMEIYAPHMSYESQKKKLRVSIQELETKIMVVLNTNNPIFKIEKNKDDKRIKEIGFWN